MALIDLGELRDEPGPEAPPPRPPRAAGRPLRVVLALALVVATVGGAAPAPRRDSFVVPAAVGAEAFLDADRLYVVEPAEGQTGTVEVRAYALPGREPAAGRPATRVWRAPVPAAGRFWQARSGRGVVLFAVTGEQDGGWTVALDAGTGRERWRQPGYPWWDSAGTLLLQSGGEDAGTVRSVDPTSGRAIWSLSTSRGGAMYSVRGGRVDRVVLASARGRVEVRDVRTGAVLHAADLRLGELPGFGYATVAHGLLLALRPEAGVVTAYGLDGLRPRWEARLPLAGHVEDCGEVLCVNGRTGGFSALDPATGTVRWTGDRWLGVSDHRGGRLLAMAHGPVGERLAVLDAATGREVADLGTWQLVPGHDGERLLAVRPAATGGGLVVGELDVAAGRVRVLDVLRDASGDCRGGVGTTLLCRVRGGDYGVWRLPG
ncbi:outer membrane protein assembly factor BamB family protein [Micromonospora sp. CPCC 205561]|uniref:outer membrane protein assembly factor BamB family protein n=1 Tax=Micromonospora sp. CPCC 205561 TaxID=3122407 RepID=UPI002FEF0DD8